jgi:sugar phosphate isomerase/epimerase
MMKLALGICSEEVIRPSVDEALAAIRGYGFKAIQFNMVNVYGMEIPPADIIDPMEMERIGRVAEAMDLNIIALNGTFNMLGSDPEALKKDIESFEKMASVCSKLGKECKLMTLCTGSRNPYSKWSAHPFNQTAEGWKTCKDVTKNLLAIAEKYDLYLGLETECGNVVNSAKKARQYIDELETNRIKIILDISNMVNDGEATPEDIDRITKEAFDYLGEDIMIAHAKDLLPRAVIDWTNAGRGIVNFDLILQLLEKYNYNGYLVVHHMDHEKEDIEYSIDFLNKKMGK